MQIVTLPRKRMLDIASSSTDKGLKRALEAAHMDQLSSKDEHIPPHVRKTLRSVTLDSYLHTQTVYYAPIYAPAFVFTAVNQTHTDPILSVFTVLSLLILPLSILAWIHRKQRWAVSQVESLFEEAFIFVHNGRLYANFPELNFLEQQLSELESMRHTAKQSSKSIADLAQKLKEKLILMGQSTNDTTLADLENQYLLQQRLITEATAAMDDVENKRQRCLHLRQELFNWVELDWMKQKASQFTGAQTSEKMWAQAAEMELIAHDLNLLLSGVHGELGTALAQWQTRHEISNL